MTFCIAISSTLFGQDSLSYGQTFEIESLRYPLCVRWGEDWAEQQFNSLYSSYFDSIAIFIKSNPQATFEIRCYTDFRGSDSSNLRISQNRANDWVRHLKQRGVDKNAIEGIGVGEMFARKVWYNDNVYYTQKPKGIAVAEIYLDEDYINSFKNNREKFEYLHHLNRRTELTVSDIDESAQRKVNYNLYLKKLHGDKQVEVIGLGAILKNDTIQIVNKGTLHLHLVAIGTENEFWIRSLDSPEEHYYHHVFHGEEEKLVDLSSSKGLYELEQFGDGGAGKTFLLIQKE